MRLLADLCPLLCLLLLRAGSATAAHDNNYCTITPPSRDSLPPAPRVYNVALSMVDDQGSGRSSAFEYFDGNVQKSSFQSFTREGGFRAIVNFVTNQVQVINMNNTGKLLDSCQVQNIPAGDILTEIMFGSKSYFLPSKFFFGGGSIGIEAQGQENINGVQANKFYSCYYAPSSDRSLKITWYFSPRSEPVRVIVAAKDNSKGTTITITHDISRFGAGNPGWPARMSPFMAPAGLYCRNLNSQGRKPMTLPNKFSMRIERIAVGGSTATYMREAYDFKANMSLLVGYPPETSGDGLKYGAGKLLYIHDFRRGLSYIRNEDMGNCTYERLASVDWDSQKDGNQLRIRTPREFFDLDSDNVQYKGVGYTRDILTDVFINYKQLELTEGLKFDTTVEWYFINRTVVDPETKLNVIESVPMSVLITSEASWLSSWLYIYDFDEKDPVFNRHDIAACFSNDAKKHFQIYFPLVNEKVVKYIRDNPNDFTSLLIPIISTGLNVSPLRVLDPEVTISGSTAILELTITDKPRFQTNVEETPLNEIESAMNILVNKGDVLTAITVDKDFYVITANKAIVVEERSNNLKSIGYSAGVLVGVGFVMVLLGLAFGVAVVFGIYKFRGGTLLGLDPFQPQRL